MKRLITSALVLSIVLGMTAPALAWEGLSNTDLNLTVSQAEQLNKLNIYFDGQQFIYDEARYGTAYIDADRTFIPMRVIAEHFGLTVSWDGTTATAKCEGPNGLIEMRNGEHFITIAGVKKESDVEVVQIKNGITYVGLRIFLNAIGIPDENISWRPGIININTTGYNINDAGKSIKGTSDFASLPTLMNALNEHLNSGIKNANWNNDITGQLYFGYYDTYVKVGVPTRIYGSASAMTIDGVWFGQGAEPQYKVVFAMLKDLLNTEDYNEITSFLTTFKNTVGEGYDRDIGTTQKAQEYMKSIDYQTYNTKSGSGVSYGFSEYCNIFKVNFPVQTVDDN